jgi:hypothetical protein
LSARLLVALLFVKRSLPVVQRKSISFATSNPFLLARVWLAMGQTLKWLGCGLMPNNRF